MVSAEIQGSSGHEWLHRVDTPCNEKASLWYPHVSHWLKSTLPSREHNLPDETAPTQLREIFGRKSPCESLSVNTTAAQQWKKWHYCLVEGSRQVTTSICAGKMLILSSCTGSSSPHHASIFQETPYKSQRNPDLKVNK